MYLFYTRTVTPVLSHTSSSYERETKPGCALDGNIERRKTLLRNFKYSEAKLGVLEEAKVALAECRRVLKHTYCFAYYLSPCAAQEIFESNQVYYTLYFDVRIFSFL